MYFGESLNTISLGSHPLELKFGEIRQGSNGNDTSENALYIISKSLIRERLLRNLGKNPNPVRGRCYLAGSKTSDGWDLDFPDTIIFDAIPKELISICNNEILPTDFFDSNAWKLTTFLREKTPTIIPKLSGVNSGTRIISRNHNYERK